MNIFTAISYLQYLYWILSLCIDFFKKLAFVVPVLLVIMILWTLIVGNMYFIDSIAIMF